MSTTLVLAVDDEPALLKITERALQQGGYAV
jgi:CheY-like chemotaxis protein